MNRKYLILCAALFVTCFVSLQLMAVSKHKEMIHHQPKYVERTGDAWQNAGRIVGELNNPPKELTIEFYSISQGKIIYTYKAPGQLYVYQSRFLPPGNYRVTFRSPGYDDYVVRSVKVKSQTDCFLNIKFGRKVFVNR